MQRHREYAATPAHLQQASPLTWHGKTADYWYKIAISQYRIELWREARGMECVPEYWLNMAIGFASK